jgi:hypothetical protein
MATKPKAPDVEDEVDTTDEDKALEAARFILDRLDRIAAKAFVKLTRHKTNGWAARLSDLLFPTDEKNWGIQPTPMPELAKAAKQAQPWSSSRRPGQARPSRHGNQERAKEYLLEQAQAYATIHG